MKRDFAMRIDTFLWSARESLAHIADHMRNHVSYGDLSQEEFKHYLQFIGKCMGETVRMSNELYAAFPDIKPDELTRSPRSWASRASWSRAARLPSTGSPVVDDILGKVAEMVHRNGLEIFAWMTTRFAQYGLQDSPDYRCVKYDFETKKMERARGLNLFHPDILRRLEGLFRDLGRCPIDGILFQDDLILRHDEDFSAEANKAFLKEFGYLPRPDLFYIDPYQSESGKYYVKAYTDRFWTWASWKNRWLMSVAKRLMEAARESNPNLQFAINLYFEAVLSESNGMAWFSQTLPGALKNNFDYYAVMAYHRQAMKDRKIEGREAMGLMTEAAQKAIEIVGDPSRVLMKIWTLDWKRNGVVSYDLASGKEIEEILTAILNQGEVSLAFVPYVDELPLHSLKGKWNSSKKSSEIGVE